MWRSEVASLSDIGKQMNPYCRSFLMQCIDIFANLELMNLSLGSTVDLIVWLLLL